MIKLIKNELSKIFKKKVIYILFTIIALIIIANTIIGTNIYGGIVIDHTEEAREQEQIELGNKIKELDNVKNINEYIEVKTKLDMVNLEREYPLGSWQERAIVKNTNKIEQMLKEINIYTYQTKDNEKLEKVKKTYNDFFNPLKENKWRDFINFQIKELEANIENLEKEIIKEKNKEQKDNLESQMEQYKFDLEFLKIRLEQNISYEKSDRNTLIEAYKDNKQALKFYTKSYEQYNYKEKIQYNKILANANELEYKIYNNIPTLEPDNARDMLNNIFQFYEILIILVIVIVSGSIVSDEFNKGTIKLLLVKPHERWKILLSKLIAAIILAIILILFIVIVQFLVGGCVYGFEDYSKPLIQYNFNTQGVMEINVFCNVIILMLAKIPMYLLVLSITFAISTISSNTALSIVLGILTYLSKNIFYLNENMEFSKYLLPVNWDFTMYLYGKLPEVSFLKFDFSIMICLVSYIFIMLITFAYFKNKDVKNI
ncbi:MAG: ABC transporter permease subunit [Clostridia bacterium]|nr:ABC transporter permease subunit [Clostridia bacterium]